MRADHRVVVIGLDGVPPQLVFHRWRDELHNFSRLMNGGIYGGLRSTDPPITVPAWTCMVTGKDPGQIGCYGFRNRLDHSYRDLVLADSTKVKEPTLWKILSRKNMRSIVLGVPQTYPPQPLRGLLAAGFLAPGERSSFTYPAHFREELDRICDGYLIDVPSFRTSDKTSLRSQLWEMTRKRFKVVRHLIRKEQWDFFMVVEMGPDRLHHGFWRCFDEGHPLHRPGDAHEDTVKQYYLLLDEELGSVVDLLGPQDTLLVVSDHGARPMMGGVRINEWLSQKGHLRLDRHPVRPTKFHPSMVDWEDTRAWSEGGYYARVFINLRGREPSGRVEPSDYDRFREDLAQEIREMEGPEGGPLGNRVMYPEQLYRSRRGVPPDLIVYLGDLAYRSIGTVGGGDLFTMENDTGPDGANHDPWGIFLLYEPWRSTGKAGLQKQASILDIAPTVLDRLGLEVPGGMSGEILGGPSHGND
ncbi:MAG: alkaline phosphatase family protein [Thermodesulfobacteriota bacterium]